MITQSTQSIAHSSGQRGSTTTTKHAECRRRCRAVADRKQKSHSMAGKKLYQQSREYGNRLMRDNTCEENNTNFVCVATEDFEHVLKITEPIAKKKDTYMRDANIIKERLLVTLRFFVTESIISGYLFHKKHGIKLVKIFIEVEFPALIGRNGRQTRHDTCTMVQWN
ncbi:hypothetical protein PR048_019954 [Dryococelus australis]|uniref:Uncharacterized protein n=1 Tax=Dryococelus australis TaxID=614101 RepID=A0ABQ9H4X3_9NEOP|nr:hypothetical protein PR048_019954 [Dryococelus australis]